MEEKKKMNLDEMKKAKMPLNNEEMSMVSGAGDRLAIKIMLKIIA